MMTKIAIRSVRDTVRGWERERDQFGFEHNLNFTVHFAVITVQDAALDSLSLDPGSSTERYVLYIKQHTFFVFLLLSSIAAPHTIALQPFLVQSHTSQQRHSNAFCWRATSEEANLIMGCEEEGRKRGLHSAILTACLAYQ